jgi:hypothetical protein
MNWYVIIVLVSYRLDLFVYIVEEKSSLLYSKVLIILRKKTNFILKLLRLSVYHNT